MEIILLEDVINLGYKGEIVKVKDGYGRNFLIPQKKAVIASASAKKVLAENLRQQAHKLEAIKNNAVELGEKITAVGNLTIGAKTSSTGKNKAGVAKRDLRASNPNLKIDSLIKFLSSLFFEKI